MNQTIQNVDAYLAFLIVLALIGVSTGLTDLVQILNIPVPTLGHLGRLLIN